MAERTKKEKLLDNNQGTGDNQLSRIGQHATNQSHGSDNDTHNNTHNNNKQKKQKQKKKKNTNKKQNKQKKEKTKKNTQPTTNQKKQHNWVEHAISIKRKGAF